MFESDESQYLLGKIEAVELMVSSLSAVLSPAVAHAMLAQLAQLRAKAAPNGPYAQGVESTQNRILAALKVAADAEKTRSITGPAKH